MLTKYYEQLISGFPLSFLECILLKATETDRFSCTQTFDSTISKPSRDINVRLSDKLHISSVCCASEYYPNTKRSLQKCH